MVALFNAKGYIANGIITNKRDESLDFQALPPILRTLLVTDGTVTKCLEAYFWELIKVEPLGQECELISEDVDGMGCIPGETIIRRHVSLTGVESGDVYAYASSIIRVALVPEGVRDALLQGRIGIGELLRQKGLETYREIVDIYRTINEPVLPGAQLVYCGELICRTYRIHLQHSPAIRVTEKFPYRLFMKHFYNGA